MTSDEGVEVQSFSASKLFLATVILSHAVNHLQGGVLPVLYPDIMKEFNIDYVQLGILQFSSSFATGFPQMFVGFLRNYFSGRLLLGVGNLIKALFNIIASVTNGFQEFLASRLVGGIGGSTQHPIGTSLLTTNSNPSWRGRILGINLSIPMLGSMMAPIIAAVLLRNVGWRFTMAIIAVPALIISCIILILAKEKSKHVMEDGSVYSLKGFKDVLRNRNVLAISLIRMVTAFREGVRAFLPLYFINVLGISTELSSALYTLLLLGGVLGPFFWGYLSDRMDKKPLIMAILACSSLLYFSLNFTKDVWALTPLLFLMGFMVHTGLIQTILGESTDRSHLDPIFGLYYTLGFTLGSLSSVVFGYVVDTYGFSWGFSYVAAITATSIIPAKFIKEL